jgi:hypothetical protein
VVTSSFTVSTPLSVSSTSPPNGNASGKSSVNSGSPGRVPISTAACGASSSLPAYGSATLTA